MPRQRLNWFTALVRPVSCVVVALGLVGVSAGPGQDTPAVLVELEQCLDAGCKRVAPIAPDQAVKIEPTLWNSARRRGLMVRRSAMQPPNRLRFGAMQFDRIAFSPTRPMEVLYDIDRLSFWKLDAAPYIVRRAGGRFLVRLPRRTDTLLLVLPAGAKAEDFSAAPHLGGVTWTLFGLTRTRGVPVFWNGRAHVAFPEVSVGRTYRVEHSRGVRVRGGSWRSGMARWEHPYRTLNIGDLK